jgi:hypothetical protein
MTISITLARMERAAGPSLVNFRGGSRQNAVIGSLSLKARWNRDAARRSWFGAEIAARNLS